MARIARELDDFRELVGRDLFENWKTIRIPEVGVEANLDDGLQLLCGDGPADLARQFFQRGWDFGTRVLAEKVCQKRKWPRFAFPANQGKVRRLMAYCGLLSGRALDPEVARTSAGEIVEFYSARIGGEEWDEFAQRDFIAGVVFLLLAKEFAAAVSVIQLGWECPNNSPRWRLVRNVGEELFKGKATQAIRTSFDKHLERVRKPLRAETVAAFELHLLSQLIDSPTADLDPLAAVARMSR